MDITEEYRVVEFCAGYSGISLGLKRAIPNLRVVAVSEIEAFAAANLVAKMEAGLLDPTPVWPDLKTFPSRKFHGLVDLLIAGFPCQPFSAAGKRAGTEDPRHLFPHIVRAAADMGLPDLFLENVEGIISAKTLDERPKLKEYCNQVTERLGATFGKRIYSLLLKHAGISVLLHVLRELERMGYVATAGVFSAAEIGAPHQRKRVFIYAVSDHHGRRVSVQTEGQQSGEQVSGSYGSERRTLWPSRPGEQQHSWEPPRVVENSGRREQGQRGNTIKNITRRGENAVERPLHPDTSDRSSSDTAKSERSSEWQTQPPMGRDVDGFTDRLDYAELYSTCDNRTDELRLLGNGVVPDTAERAWRILSARLANAGNSGSRDQS